MRRILCAAVVAAFTACADGMGDGWRYEKIPPSSEMAVVLVDRILIDAAYADYVQHPVYGSQDYKLLFKEARRGARGTILLFSLTGVEDVMVAYEFDENLRLSRRYLVSGWR